jgi:hypothetical protein
LVLSDQSNDSQFVRKEVERAVSKTKPVLPVRIREVTPSGSLDFYISSAQWVDAWKSPMEQHLMPLVAAIKAMNSPGAAPVRSSSLPAQQAPSRSLSPLLMVVAIIAVLAAGIAGTLWYTSRTTTTNVATKPEPAPTTSAPVVAPPTPAPMPTPLPAAAVTAPPATPVPAAAPASPPAAPIQAAAAPAVAAPTVAAPTKPAPAAGPKRNDIAFVVGNWCQPYNGLTIRYEILRTGPDTILTRVNHPQAPNWDVASRVVPAAGGFDFQPVDEAPTDKNTSHFEIVDDTMMKLTRSEGEAQDGSIIRMRCAAE